MRIVSGRLESNTSAWRFDECVRTTRNDRLSEHHRVIINAHLASERTLTTTIADTNVCGSSAII